MKQVSLAPTTKVVAGGVAGAATVIIVWCMQRFGGITIPVEIGVALSTVLSFLVSWITPPTASDAIEERP